MVIDFQNVATMLKNGFKDRTLAPIRQNKMASTALPNSGLQWSAQGITQIAIRAARL
jgi:hypothetical protein